MSLRDVLAALNENGLRKEANGWGARCPSHDDKRQSLSVGQGESGKVLLHCHAGCELPDVLRALGLTSAALFEDDRRDEAPKGERRLVATYEYTDENGAPLYRVLRYDPKDFRQQRFEGGEWKWGGMAAVRKVLYRLPALAKDSADDLVFVVEGEKDADLLASMGATATTNAGGAGKWLPEYSESLRGRHVAILPDNDKPGEDHAVMVAKSLAGIAASATIVRLPGLPPKGDAWDWLARRGKHGMVELAGLWSAGFDRGRPFKSAPSRIVGEREERKEMGARALSFGVRFLDEALGGIMPRDLIIVGAKTGVGKTALATITALHNCQQGRRVHYFALEAEDREIERRMKYQIIAERYFATRYMPTPIRFLDWYMGRLDETLGQFEDEADAELGRVLGKLFTFYRLESFTSDDFSAQLSQVKDETDLVVLDHLHYVDTDDENENRGYKRIVKQIRDAVLRAGKPVIVVAHVRKGDRRIEPLVPTVEDFHGSSDIPKIATKAVMLAPAYDMPNAEPHLWNTFIQIAKCRADSSVTRFVASTVFDARKNTYADAYLLGRLTDAGKTFTALPEAEIPHWAQGARA